MLITFFEFIQFVLSVYKLVLLAAVLLSWFPLSESNPIVFWLRRVTDPVLNRIRSLLPDFGAVDLSPLVAFFGISLPQSALMRLELRLIQPLL